VLVHWDDVPKTRRALGNVAATWTDLGRAAGSVGVGVRRIELAPGEVPTPAHVHGGNEEVFYVLGGSGLSWQDGETYEIAAGDALVHHALGKVHTLRAGDDGLDVLAFGERASIDGAYLPRAGVYWLYPAWAEAGGGAHPFEREPPLELPAAPSARPSTIANVRDVEPVAMDGETVSRRVRDLGRAVGSRQSGLKHCEVAPGKLNAPPHCHSAEEELFVILAGEGVLQLGDEEHAVRPGHVLSRPPGTGVAHAFRAGDAGLTLLAYGTREPNDIVYYPRSDKVFLRGVGLVGRIERLDYWDGER
jgi:uncharacterized cupin superfamily protein